MSEHRGALRVARAAGDDRLRDAEARVREHGHEPHPIDALDQDPRSRGGDDDRRKGVEHAQVLRNEQHRVLRKQRPRLGDPARGRRQVVIDQRGENACGTAYQSPPERVQFCRRDGFVNLPL